MAAFWPPAKALQTYMGHASVSNTLDRYGCLVPGSAAEPAGLLDTYLTAEQKRSALECAGLRVQSMVFRFWMTVP